MRVKIYQVNSDRDTNGVKFRGLDQEAVSQGEVQIDSSVYDEVFNAEMDFDGLQDLFTWEDLGGRAGTSGYRICVILSGACSQVRQSLRRVFLGEALSLWQRSSPEYGEGTGLSESGSRTWEPLCRPTVKQCPQ